MKNSSTVPFVHPPSMLERLRPSLYLPKRPANAPGQWSLLIGLMVPVMMVSLNFSLFGVALPAIRAEFGIQADMTAWLVTSYMLPFMMFMPLYGRLGDGLGKRQLFLIGVIVFIIGTVTTLLAPTMGWLLVGLATQGFGAAAITPLSMAIISQLFPLGERGKTLGTWSSVAPLMGLIGPFLGGLLIDYLGWRVIFGPVLLIGLAAFIAVQKKLPSLPGEANADSRFLRTFDWGGVALLSVTITSIIFYASSRPITGVSALQDWRLLAIALMLLTLFIYWERRRPNPFVPLKIFSYKTFRTVSFCSSIRMFSMSGILFLVPLYLTDVYDQSAAAIGAMLMGHAGALFIIMRLGGQLADRWGSRGLIIAGLTLQGSVMACFAFMPATAPLALIVVGLVLHGLGAGVSFAALDRGAMDELAQEEVGIAVGLYSMSRFGGFMVGTALTGVLLQYSLEHMAAPVQAYQVVFGAVAGVALLGVLVGLKLPKN